uniref:Septin, putative n=1 Tax=Paramecium tetraurelia TaxID=5888 RepID=Q3SEE0_PARTE|nr:septin, putative [Paramecium tetraurelia]
MIDLISSPSPIPQNSITKDQHLQCNWMQQRFLFTQSHCKKIDFDNSHTTKSIFPISSQEEIRIPSAKIEIKELQDPSILSTYAQSYIDKNQFSLSCGPQKSQVTLNLLIAGQSGTGKSTFVDALLNKVIILKNNIQKPISRQYEGNRSETNNVQESMGIIEYDNQIVYLNIFDAKGFQKNNQKDWFKDIRHLIDQKFKTQIRRNKYAYLNKTLYSQMSNLVNDERIHLCLYFLSGPAYFNEDIQYLQKLSNLVNVIPILARGDQYTKSEVLELKLRYNTIFKEFKIDLYDCLKINDESFKQQLKYGEFGQCSPFMIIASTYEYYNEQGKKIQGRQYPWGQCDLWNPQHSDFLLLYKSLIGYYIYDLIKLTDFYQHSFVKRKQETQKKNKSRMGFLNSILVHINQILYLMD